MPRPRETHETHLFLLAALCPLFSASAAQFPLHRDEAKIIQGIITAELEKSHKDWKATAMDNGVQSFVSTRYVPKVVERINVLNGSGMARVARPHLT